MRIRDEEGYFVLAKSAWMVPCVCALVLEGEKLLSLFPNFWVELVRPQANIIVHILVGVAIDNTSPSIYHMIPYFIVLTINNEML
ncbi:hypothetical protein JHK82_026129 [Glycine max]|uniref:Uncharacterized protein n=2 Tax=Glycine subgen. Soja TaxID=1462606 RepID=A0A0R0IIY7_SOYBN|nr:hypothetical protein JHK85_026739 [Glycine max]KAG5013994.1 hypothetical protein JHK86_026255 [Glycine max]KAG5134941.1 hypothetical protein JHK82_026129 [Glycine max]KAH1044685.1 hypothetical protein GYH30_026108 [Glycine max]RZB93754.1 hypothetical protein D0Y65_025205 [Glycine soja]